MLILPFIILLVICGIDTGPTSVFVAGKDDVLVRSAKPRYFNTSYAFPPDQPVIKLDAKEAFEALSDRERLYAHYMSRASVIGGLIVLLQTSQESPQIFRLIQRIYISQTPKELLEAFKDNADITEDDLHAFFVYSSGIYDNMGNYKSFGDSKFVPDLPVDKFEAIIQGSKAWQEEPEVMSQIWDSIKDKVWSLSEKERLLGLGEKGVTKYFSANCDKSDAEKVSKFLQQNHIEAWMTRVIKTTNESDGKPVYEIRHAAVENSTSVEDQEFDGAHYKITSGDYSGLLKLVNQELENAKKSTANDVETSMLGYYVDSFEDGSLDAHKNGSRLWIENKSPNVETYLGFIEVYRDPAGERAEFEGFVSMVNKLQSVKFQNLVKKAEELLPKLPWPKTFEKDRYLKPDFTSLDVLTFAGSGIPKGINIPNYGEIRQSEGFKNVNLGNVVSSTEKSSQQKTNFVSEEDHELLKEYKTKSFDVQVGLHELLGHGSGKLFSVDKNGKANFLEKEVKNPITGEPINVKAIYKPGETYESRFSSLSSAFEECRAESVGLYLSVDDSVLRIFGFENNTEVIKYVNWLSLCTSAIAGIEFYSPQTKEWKQAHAHARFAILRVLFEAGEEFVTMKEVVGSDGEPDLSFTMDRNKLQTVGIPAIGKFLEKLQVYKSLGDIESAKKMFEGYTILPEDDKWIQWRDIIISRKKPRKMFVQANTIKSGGKVQLEEYDASPEGLIESWRARFNGEEYQKIDQVLQELYELDLPYFKE